MAKITWDRPPGSQPAGAYNPLVTGMSSETRTGLRKRLEELDAERQRASRRRRRQRQRDRESWASS
jgi:hypothetical protein